MIKVLAVQTINNNLGDPILAENDCYLIRKAFAERGEEVCILNYKIAINDPTEVRYVDAVVFAGGIIKTATEKFWFYMLQIIEEANKYDIPVFFSAIGAEPFDGSEEAVRLKRALNMSNVKGISARDDIKSLMDGWITNPYLKVTSVYDPAIWCPYCYDVEPTTHPEREKKLVGLGIIRPAIFEEYGHPEIDYQYQLDFWKDTAALLEQNGYDWIAFTNGPGPDEVFAREVIEYIGYGSIMPCPIDGKMLIENINELDLAIAGRMHSSIISYSLGKPCIGLVWNQKLRFWGQKIEHPERLLEVEEMTPENAVKQLIQADAVGIHHVKEEQYQGVYQALKAFVDEWCVAREGRDSVRIDPQKKLVAMGLGPIEKRNNLSNSINAFEYSYNHGYRNFHLNVIYTADKVAVCLNNWEVPALRKLGLIREEACKLTYDEFKVCKTYDRFPVLSLKDFFEYLSARTFDAEIQVVLDVGFPAPEDMGLFEDIRSCLDQYECTNVKFFLKIGSSRHWSSAKQTKARIIFALPESDAKAITGKQRKALFFCKAMGIKTISMSPSTYSKTGKLAAKRYGLDCFVTSTKKPTAIIDLLRDRKIRFLGSHCYEVDYMDDLAR